MRMCWMWRKGILLLCLAIIMAGFLPVNVSAKEATGNEGGGGRRVDGNPHRRKRY